MKQATTHTRVDTSLHRPAIYDYRGDWAEEGLLSAPADERQGHGPVPLGPPRAQRIEQRQRSRRQAIAVGAIVLAAILAGFALTAAGGAA